MSNGIEMIPNVAGKNFIAYNGDCVEVTSKLPDECVDFMVFSPPFANLYIYSDDIRDMGNCKGEQDFFNQYGFLSEQLYRILRTGRLMAVHCKQIVRYKGRDGVAGWTDFRGDLIRHYEAYGFTYHSEVVIWTDPVLEMQKTKTQRLLYCQLRRDASHTGIGMPEYLLIFRKWDETKEDKEIPIRHYKDVKEAERDGGDVSQVMPLETWQKYASPVWFDIKRTDVLNVRMAKDSKDEKHLCLAEGTLVLTKRGYIPIETIEANIDEVLTNSGEWHKVVAKAKTRENAEVIQVVAQGVPKLIATPDHKIMVKRGYGVHPKDNLCRTESQWIAANELSGCYVKAVMPPEIESKIDLQEWWIIGRWLADGHIDSRGHQFMISVGKDKWDEFKLHAEKHIGHVSYNECCNCYQVGIIGLSDASRAILKKCGKGAKNKVLPVECISLNNELSEALYCGYMSGDGHVVRDGKETASSASRGLLLGIAIVAQKIKNKVAAVYAGRESHESVIRGRNIRGGQEWNMVISPHYSFSAISHDETWKKVYRVKNAGKADVWSIEVDADHSFMAEGCIVKNCPLQLPVIERAIELWSNPGEVVLTPFMGIGSEVYEAVKMGRKGIGVELKKSYFDTAVRNIKGLEDEMEQPTLFDFIGETK